MWKLDGLSDYDIRRPMTPSRTNLIGLVKHSTVTHVAYFGEVSGGASTVSASGSLRASDLPLSSGPPPRSRGATSSTATTTVGYQVDATIAELPLDTVGSVWWWGDADVTLHHVLLHVIADTQRHAGHADILRELIDGSTGMLRQADSLHIRDPAAQQRFHDQVEAEAAKFRYLTGCPGRDLNPHST